MSAVVDDLAEKLELSVLYQRLLDDLAATDDHQQRLQLIVDTVGRAFNVVGMRCKYCDSENLRIHCYSCLEIWNNDVRP